MNPFNLIITCGVFTLMCFGAGMTYHYRSLEAQHETGMPVAMVSPTQFAKNVVNLHSSLPKWDDKNYKGPDYHPPGYFKKKAEAAKQKQAGQ